MTITLPRCEGRCLGVLETVEIVADFACETGECPVWHPAEQALYWADIPRGFLFRYDPGSGRSEVVYEAGEQLGGLLVQEDASLLLFLEEGRVRTWRDGRVANVCEGIEREAGNRFNDAATDSTGRVLAGTMPGPDGTARLYRFDYDGSYRLLLGGLGQSNGMEFAKGGSELIHTDTKRKTLSRFQYDSQSGTVADPEVLVRVEEDGVVPDGLVIDAEGMLLSAMWGGSRISKYLPTGEGMGSIDLPTAQVSSLAFGGPSFSDLYVTTAGGHRRDEFGPVAGALFRLRGVAAGCGPPLSRIRL